MYCFLFILVITYTSNHLIFFQESTLVTVTLIFGGQLYLTYCKKFKLIQFIIFRWEMDNNYCEYVKNSEFYMKTQNKHLLLDLMEMSVFDFLIDNGDRHHYEFFKKMPTPRSLLLDNGKR